MITDQDLVRGGRPHTGDEPAADHPAPAGTAVRQGIPLSDAPDVIAFLDAATAFTSDVVRHHGLPFAEQATQLRRPDQAALITAVGGLATLLSNVLDELNGQWTRDRGGDAFGKAIGRLDAAALALDDLATGLDPNRPNS